MTKSIVRLILAASALTLAACGGGGGTEIATIPPPPPPPPPTSPQAIIPAATMSQQFAAVGASHSFDHNSQTPLLDSDHQLQVRYIQSSNSYEIEFPESAWEPVLVQGNTVTTPQGGIRMSIRPTDSEYSSLFSWGDGATYFGFEAIGIATPASGVPVTGSANYSGQTAGSTSEIYLNSPLGIRGPIELSFDFGLGTLSGNISPTIFSYVDSSSNALGTISFTNTVYSTGSTTFSGKFDTNLPGVNSFSGLFTGPHAEELIGNFALPYQSPIDNQTYQADGAFVGAK